jgi:Xaa-Pro aminopeptidase
MKSIFKNLNNFIISSRSNVFYLTGIKSSFGFLVLTKEESFFATDSRYFLKAQETALKNGFTPIMFDTDFTKNFGKKFKGKFKIEDSVRFSTLSNFKKWFPNVELEIKKSSITEFRRNKKTEEIAKIKKAIYHVDNVLIEVVKQNLKLGITENQLAWEIEKEIRKNGNFTMSFDTIVAFGSNSAIPHHETSERRLKNNENVLIDLGAKFENYCSDMTRNFFFGIPSKEYLEIFSNLKLAQEATVSKYKTGEKVKVLDHFCRTQMGEFEKFFTHSLGHGVGIQIHEAPKISAQSEEILVQNEVVTCEPGIYLAGKFGIRIEDMILVGDSESEVLTKTPRDLEIVQI